MFHLHSLKEPPPNKKSETINFTSEVEATISSQESQPPPIQRQVDQSTASEAVEINITELFQPADFNFPKSVVANRLAAFHPSGFRNFPGYTTMSKAILCYVSFAGNKMQNKMFELPEVLFSIIPKGFSKWKKALAQFKEHQVSECHKIAIDYETNLSRTCGKVWEMSSDAAKKTMEKSLNCPARTGYAGWYR